MTALRELSLVHLDLNDLSPLAGLNLTSLDLTGTNVVDLQSIREMKSLETLTLDRTPVRDLSPIRELERLVESAEADEANEKGLFFSECRIDDPEVEKYSRIEQPKSTRKTINHLRRAAGLSLLGDWAEDEPSDDHVIAPLELPTQSAEAPQFTIDGAQVDVAPAARDGERGRPVKSWLFKQMNSAFSAFLVRDLILSRL